MSQMSILAQVLSWGLSVHLLHFVSDMYVSVDKVIWVSYCTGLSYLQPICCPLSFYWMQNSQGSILYFYFLIKKICNLTIFIAKIYWVFLILYLVFWVYPHKILCPNFKFNAKFLLFLDQLLWIDKFTLFRLWLNLY